MNSLSSLSVAPLSLWIAFSVGVLVLLALDVSLFGRRGHVLTTKAALVESGLWILVAIVFNVWFGTAYGWDLGVEFLTGYLVEKSLSVDNLFVILLIFGAFRIPKEDQHRVLFYGVLGAIVLRAFFIVVGAQLLAMFHWILAVFGLILIVTAIKLLRNTDDEKNVQDSGLVRWMKRALRTSESTAGHRFFVVENGVRKATPLFLALIVVEFTDLVFAIDSIPAVFAVTQDAFVAFASNILAILGLRALYFVLAEGAGKLRYLKPGLAAVLGFIGVKMLILDFVKIPGWVSLLVIVSILATAGLSSWYVARSEAKSG